mgnify:CR=1 FL=1
MRIVFLSTCKRPAGFRHDPAFVYRCENPGHALAARGVDVHYDHVATWDESSGADCVVVQRPRASRQLRRLVDAARRGRVRLVADVDDLVFDEAYARWSAGAKDRTVRASIAAGKDYAEIFVDVAKADEQLAQAQARIADMSPRAKAKAEERAMARFQKRLSVLAGKLQELADAAGGKGAYVSPLREFTTVLSATALTRVSSVARRFEEDVRGQFETDDISVHIIGFAKVIGDVKDGANRVLLFFLIAIVITTILVYLYSQSWRVTGVAVICSLLAVTWQLGLLPLIGIGIDPMGLLVPFLVFAIGVSHGVQMVSSYAAEVHEGADSMTAARATFRRLLVPGGIALLSDTIGFITIMLIEIRMIQEMAITASLGVAIIILTDLILVPVLLLVATATPASEDRRLSLIVASGTSGKLVDDDATIAGLTATVDRLAAAARAARMTRPSSSSLPNSCSASDSTA